MEGFLAGPQAPPPRVVSCEKIVEVVRGSTSTLVDAMSDAFVALSDKRAVVAPVVHLGCGEDRMTGGGECCIKTGFMKGAEHFVVKLATGGFGGNGALGLPTNSGAMLVMSQRTGMLEAILLDNGVLTELRTAAAGALAARHLAPRTVTCIGVVGTGIQCRFQVDLLRHVTECRRVMILGRTPDKVDLAKKDVEALGFTVVVATDVHHLCSECNLIVTVTSATSPVIPVDAVRPGTHITAVGADGAGKQELDTALVAKADLVVADSAAQCCEFGELSHAIRAGTLPRDRVVEIGALVGTTSLHRGPTDDRITVSDSTGVAVQDVQVATMVYRLLTA